MTTVVRVDPRDPDLSRLAPAAECLVRGGLVAFPTETVYGLGAHALDEAAVTRLFVAKGRPSYDPVIVHVASLAQVEPIVARLPAHAAALAERFWPGPLTLIMPKSVAVPAQVTAGLDTVAVRIPAHPVARALLTLAAVPVAAPSANLFSRPSPTRASHVLEDLDGRIDMVIDAGQSPVGVESTVLDLTSPTPVVLRYGAVPLDEIRTIVPDAQEPPPAVPAVNGPQRAPGQLATHYAPRTPLVLYEGEPEAVFETIARDALNAVARGKWVGVIAANEDTFAAPTANVRVVRVGPEGDSAEIARRLYAAFRELDAVGVELILVRAFSVRDGLGYAIRDRLRRAAAQIVTCPRP